MGLKPITTNCNFLWGASGLQPALYSLRPKTIRHQHKDTHNDLHGQGLGGIFYTNSRLLGFV